MKRIAVVTTTFYDQRSLDSSSRFASACKTTVNLARMGFLHINVDASPSPVVARVLTALGAKVFREEAPGGIGPSRRQGIRIAQDEFKAGDIAWMEIEKYDYVQYIDDVMQPIQEDSFDIVHAGRTKEGWESYPAFQAHLEHQHAKEYGELLGLSDLEPDPYMGPAGYSEKMARAIRDFDPKVHGLPDTYINIYFPVYAHRKLGARLGFPKVPFLYPLEQKAEEEGVLAEDMEKKRRWQAKLMDGVKLLAAA